MLIMDEVTVIEKRVHPSTDKCVGWWQRLFFAVHQLANEISGEILIIKWIVFPCIRHSAAGSEPNAR